VKRSDTRAFLVNVALAFMPPLIPVAHPFER
jgi:hypothetical protein